ncbi:DUF3168 domain-containing protein [Sinorhizobium meliloti]|uniref:DUF3168 domain-containing protein n=1 Tax=Rhizobium meliloti TaxID=382 RepID=UPI000FD9CA0D|nr:DUF3168 domain-containing protein [Sinorhizobium meliloti]RVG25045.1 DUF3168 domain-containing protein [Sinorhizobium meliloti]
MLEPTLALQAAIGNALAADTAVTAHVDPANIRGGTMRPEAFPCILMGGGQTEFLGHASGGQYVARVFLTVHIWALEDGAEMAKAIGFAVMNTLKDAPAATGFHIDEFALPSVAWMRDPDPAQSYCHGVMTVEAVMRWAV